MSANKKFRHDDDDDNSIPSNSSSTTVTSCTTSNVSSSVSSLVPNTTVEMTNMDNLEIPFRSVGDLSTKIDDYLTVFVKLNKDPSYVEIQIPPRTKYIGELHKLIIQELQLTSIRPSLVELKIEGSDTVLDSRITIQNALKYNILHDGASLLCITPENGSLTESQYKEAHLAGVQLREAILKATETDVGNGIKIVKLADPRIKFPGLGNVPLFIRNFYEGCFTGPLNKLTPNSHLVDKNFTYKNFIIVGNPGIGKSAFGVYLLYRAIRDKRTVVYISEKHNYAWVFHDDGRVVPVNQFDKGSITRLDELNKENNILICDSMEPPFVPAFTVLITSPRQSRFKEFRKIKGTTRLYFPVFNLNELEIMNANCGSLLDEVELLERYSRWGGIPRYIFEVFTDEGKRFLDNAVSQLSAEYLPEIVKNPEFDTEKDYSHRLIHIKIQGEKQLENQSKIEPTDPQYYAFSHLDIATDDATIKLIEYTKQKKLSTVVDFLKCEVDDEHLGVLYGKILEKYFFYQLKHRIASSFTVRKLLDNGKMDDEQSLTIPSDAVIKNFTGIDELIKLYNENPSNIFVPQSKTFCAIDGILPQQRFFNVTKNDKHPLHMVSKIESKNAGLLQTAKSMGLLSGSSSSSSTTTTTSTTNTEKPIIHFYWVVPDTVYKTITKPLPIYEKGKLVPNYNTDINNEVIVQQWVLKFDTSHH